MDDYLRMIWTFLMKSKHEVSILISRVLSYVKTQFGSMIKCVMSDNGVEFGLKFFFGDNGIIHQLTYVKTP